jgi:hypothetical protein
MRHENREMAVHSARSSRLLALLGLQERLYSPIVNVLEPIVVGSLLFLVLNVLVIVKNLIIF